MALPVITTEGKMEFISDRQTKKERGIQEATNGVVSMPSDGMIEFSLNIVDDRRRRFWMTCEEARQFCAVLDVALCYHEKHGERNSYAPDEEIRKKLLDVGSPLS